VRGIDETADRMDILERHIEYEENAEDFRRRWSPEEQSLGERIAAARKIVDDVQYTRRDLYTIASLTSNLQIDGHRADLVILKVARANAAFEGRTHVTQGDILLAIELAIPHRLKRGPFADASMNMAQLETQLDQINSEYGEGGEAEEMSSEGEQAAVKKKAPR
jgi:Mg-chelatase subunit ChlI